VEPGIVIDTNVFASAIKSRRGASFRLLNLVGTGKFEIDLSLPLALEYEATGKRILPTTGLSDEGFEAILNYVVRSARHREIHYSWRPCLADPGDDMVLELAVAAQSRTIVSFNHADFRGVEQFGIETIGPREFLERIGELK
jgi:predicted nucleic acid-binding protein